MEHVQEFVTKYLPIPSLLPAWTLLVGTTAIINGLQNFLGDSGSKLVYIKGAKKGLVNPLQARNFGLWTLTAGVVRLYAAYNITNAAVYDIAIATYVIAAVHFFTELLVFGTCGLTGGAISPIVVASSSLFWMISQRAFYLGG
ncbi:Erg28-domain-containing protein [Dacryopinax primogenitus]|uniref:Erg28-domain-containing protein n=1 Tax=Dacryopinax primogenitus (strain DJM 731) TaxID=1858805 RepID=M5G394_DACPD|nr:Erg28-domain-containing protein [Dacryopinax primogenitus]EJU04681.1 Erg28-domain-containing protein [Dacryopinax primogenitus]